MENHHFWWDNDGKLPFLMGKSTISTGPFSMANCNRLPEGTPNDRWKYESMMKIWTSPKFFETHIIWDDMLKLRLWQQITWSVFFLFAWGPTTLRIHQIWWTSIKIEDVRISSIPTRISCSVLSFWEVHPNTIHVIPAPPKALTLFPGDQVRSQRFPQVPNEEKAGQGSQQTSSPAHHQEIHVLALNF